MKEKVEADFNKTAVTIDHAYQRLGNSLGKLFAEGSPLGDSITKMLESINLRRNQITFQLCYFRSQCRHLFFGIRCCVA